MLYRLPVLRRKSGTFRRTILIRRLVYCEKKKAASKEAALCIHNLQVSAKQKLGRFARLSQFVD